MSEPSGQSLVFFFSDIEGSTQLWERFPEAMQEALARHDSILLDSLRKHCGRVVKHTGDGIFSIFENEKALACALDIQKEIAAQDWGALKELRLRVAIHAGEAEKRGEDYFGLAINRTARLLSAGWGGQVLATHEAITRSETPKGAELIDLGSHQLKDLGRPVQIFELKHPHLILQEFPPLKTLTIRPHNLPAQPTPFLGRQQELAEVTAHLRDTPCRSLTLVGPGGMGKTRLALQAAAELIENFAQGVYFVPLAPISSAEFLVSTIADALSFSFYSSEEPRRQLLDYLRGKQMLLVLDNFEHVLEGADLLTEILKAAPKIKLLVTSRERLQIQGEWVFRLHGLEYPENGALQESREFSAIQLFLQSAMRVQPQFSPAPEDHKAIIGICDLVEGIPLGIELAASWVEVLPVAEIAAEIAQNRDFLATSLRDVPERHRSLRAVFEYSWKLLSLHERDILIRLAIFRGGFRREAALSVAGADLALLSTLVNKSLLRVQTPGRYEMLEILRTYALEKLQESPDETARVEGLHADIYTKLLEESEPALKGEAQQASLERIREEIENIRAAWRWAIAHQQHEALARAISGLYLFYEMRSWFQEGEEVFGQAAASWKKQRATAPLALPQEVIGRLLIRQGAFCQRLGQSARAESLVQEGLGLCQRETSSEKSELALAYNTLGNIDYTQGEIQYAKANHQKSLDLRDGAGDLWGIATSLSNLGVVADRLGHPSEAQNLFQESLEHRRQIGDRFGIASSLNNLGVLAARLADFERAKALHQESLAIRRQIGDRKGITESLNNLGVVADAQGEFSESRNLYEESLALSAEIGDKFSEARTLNNLGFVAFHLGEFKRALDHCAKGLKLNQEIKNQPGEVHSLNGLGNAATALEKYQDARRYLHKALAIAHEQALSAELLEVLVGIAILAMKTGENERAFRLFMLIESHADAEPESQGTARHFRGELESQLSAGAIKKIAHELQTHSLKAIIEEILRDH